MIVEKEEMIMKWIMTSMSKLIENNDEKWNNVKNENNRNNESNNEI